MVDQSCQGRAPLGLKNKMGERKRKGHDAVQTVHSDTVHLFCLFSSLLLLLLLLWRPSR